MMIDIDFDTDLIDLLRQEESNKISYLPLDLNIKSAKGSYLVDVNGKYYLDLTSNKESNPLGYSSVSQIESGYLFDSELFHTSDSLELENLLVSLTGLSKAIFTSSKPESYSIYNNLVIDYLEFTSKNKILISCLSNKRDKYKLNGIEAEFILLNNDTIARSFLTKSVGAVVVDIVQIGEDINIANTEYLQVLRELCDKNGALLVLDASSISPLRNLKGLFNFDSNIIKPDMLIISNSAAQGIPFGALILSDKLIKISGTGSTIFAYKSALKFINESTRPEILEIIKNNSIYIEKALNDLATRFITVADVVSYGMMFTIILDISAHDFVNEALKNGIIIEALNSRTIKLSPPYNICKEEIDKLILGFETVLDKLAKYDRLV